jgi:DNA-binding transcriptional LysR family regulator
MSDIDFRTLNLNLLPTLDALLAERTVGGAARRMGVSQSAMSHSLAKLRQALGDPLLVMSGRRMRLTPRAEGLLGQLPKALENLQRVLTGDEPFDPATSSRTFTLASLDYFDFAVLPTLLAYLRRRAPFVRLNVERASSDSVSRLVAGEIDVMLVGSSAAIPTQGLHRRELYRDPFRVIARADHPALGRRLSLETYLELEHVLVSVDGGGEGAVDRILRAQSRTRRVALRVPHFASAPLAVATSDLVCMIASTMAQRGRELYGLRLYEPPFAVDPAPIVMYWPAAHDADPGRSWFRGCLQGGASVPVGIRRLMAQHAAAGG